MQDFYNGGNTNNSFNGDFILNPNAKHNKYNCSVDGPTEIRVVPSFTNGKPDPLIIPGSEPGAGGISDAICKVGVVAFWGKNKYHMIDPAPPANERRGPLSYFYQYIVNYVKNNPRTCPPDWRRWQGMREDGDYQTPKRIISPPSAALMVQGLLFKHKGEVILDRNNKPTCRWPVVVVIKPSGAKTLIDQLYEPADVNAPWSEQNNKLGNMTDLQMGRTLIISPYPHMQNNVQQTWYRCDLGENIPLSEDDAKRVWVPWKDLLNFSMTIGECMEKLAETFDATSVVNVFESSTTYAQLIPDSVRAAKAREEGINVYHSNPEPVMPQQGPAPVPQYIGGNNMPQMPQVPQATQMPQMPQVPQVPQMPQVPQVPANNVTESKPTMESVFPAHRAPISLASMGTPNDDSDPSDEEGYDEQLFPNMPKASAPTTGVDRLAALRNRIQKQD